MLCLEVFFLEYIIKGGKNQAFLNNELIHEFESINFECIRKNINNIGSILKDKINRVSKESKINSITNLIKNNKLISKKNISIVECCFDLFKMDKKAVIISIFNNYTDNIKKITKLDNIENPRLELINTTITYDIKNYVNAVFRLNNNISNIWDFSVQINFAINENIITENELEEITKTISYSNIKFLISIENILQFVTLKMKQAKSTQI